MRTGSVSLAIVAGASCVQAFSNSYPLIAWSSHQIASLPTILGTNGPKSASSPFRPATHQIPLAATAEEQQRGLDLCSLSNVLLVSAPGLHYSDIALLPTAQQSESGIKAALAHAESDASEGSVTRHPYLPLRRTSAATPAQRLASKFVKECGAVVESSELRNFWAGEQGKTLRIELVEGLDEWELSGADARRGRAQIMERVDATVAAHAGTLEAPYLIVLTSASSSSLSELVKSESTRNQHSKRQYIEEEYPSPADAIDAIPAEVMDSIPKVYDGMTTTYEAEETGSEWGSANEASRVASSPFTVLADNSTSIFLPKENSGLFNRYIFFSSPLIFAIIIVGLFMVPVLILTSQALTTVETVRGLETKMTGHVGIDAAKSG